VQDRPIAELVRDVEFFNADVVIFTGQRTGHAADLDYLQKIRAAASLPTLVGSGVDPGNVSDILAIVDGVIVASSLKVDGLWNPVDRERAALRRAPAKRHERHAYSQAHARPRIERGGRSSATASFAKLRQTHQRSRFARNLGSISFVDAAARALGMPSPSRRFRNGGGWARSYGLVTDQEQVFVDAFERMGAPADGRPGLTRRDLALPLHALFLKWPKQRAWRSSPVLWRQVDVSDMVLDGNKSPSSRSAIRDWSLCTPAALLPTCRLGPWEIDTEGRRSPKPGKRG
jgi:hypothetical protein